VIEAGQSLGGYEVLAPLGTGGMASLWLARRRGVEGFERRVVIKVVHPELGADDSYRQMLIDEALMAACIEHPNVIRVEELGEHEGAYFLVMEHVDGWSLAEVLDALDASDRRMAPALATHIAASVASGLHAAHEARRSDGRPLELVHRDVSPPNILVSRGGHVKIIDCGVAKALGRGIRTTAGTVKGKFRYMSPEQSRGRPLDRRTDVYALGIVLWEMLTTRPLFDAKDEVEILMQVREPTPSPPSTIAAGIPRALDEAVLAALASNVDERPATARDLRRSLLRAVPEAATIDPTDVAEVLADIVADAPGTADESDTSPARPSARPPGMAAELTVQRPLGEDDGGTR